MPKKAADNGKFQIQINLAPVLCNRFKQRSKRVKTVIQTMIENGDNRKVYLNHAQK